MLFRSGCLNYAFGLVTKLLRQDAMPLKHLFDTQSTLCVSRAVRGYLCCTCASHPFLGEMRGDLLTAGARSVDVFLRVTFDFRLAAPAALDFVAQFLQARS